MADAEISDDVAQTEQQELCQAVAGWLSYKSLTGLKEHLNEHSMSVPIAEYLTTKHGRDIESERTHPLFKSPTRGRPKQVDFVRLKRGSTAWHAVYECKYQTDTPTRLINDICRLVALAQSSEVGNPNRYFVLAGERKAPGSPLDRGVNTGQGSRISIFDGILRRKKKDIDIRNPVKISELHPKQIDFFKKFSVANNVKLPSVFVTRLRGRAISSLYACSTWEISAARGSKLLHGAEFDTEI